MNRPSSAISKPLCGTTILAFAFSSSAASADAPCAVRSPSDEPAPWSDAVHEIERTVSELAPRASDCREIVVRPDDKGALVTFATRDGRTAMRRISTPAELLPVVEALLVTVPDVLPDETAVAVPDRSPSPMRFGDLAPPATAREEALPSTTKDRERDHGRLLLGLGAGIKAWPGNPVSATTRLELGVVHANWELGLVGQWEPEHDYGPVGGHTSLSAIGGATAFGRRVAIGPGVLVFGTSMGLFSVEADLERAPGEARRRGPETGSSMIEPRLGAYLGFVLRQSEHLRFRAQLDGAFALATSTPASDIPAFPRWSSGFTLSAETSFLP